MVINGGYPGGGSCLSASIAWGTLNPKNKAWHNFHNLSGSKNDYKALRKLVYYKSRIIDIFLSKHVKGFVSVSKSSIDSLYHRSSFKSNRKEYIYNGIDLDANLEDAISIKIKYNLPNDAKIVSVLGIYELRKGQDFIVKVFQKISRIDKNIYLFMFGEGKSSYIDYLKKLIGDNKNIYLENYQNDIRQIYKGTDILAIPSQSYESFGYTAIEAMFYKVPIIATNIGGLPEVIDDNVCGYILDKNDVDSFVEKIKLLCDDDSKRKEFGINGYERYERQFKAKMMATKYMRLVKEN